MAQASAGLLLAEDDDVSALYAEVVLRSFGCTVSRVKDGNEALAALKDEQFDVAFVDVHMPGMDGLTVLRSHRSIEREEHRVRLPIVVITASAFEHEVRQCYESGADHVITKPFLPEQLRTTLAGCVMSRQDSATARR